MYVLAMTFAYCTGKPYPNCFTSYEAEAVRYDSEDEARKAADRAASDAENPIFWDIVKLKNQ